MNRGRAAAAVACLLVASSCIFDLPEGRTRPPDCVGETCCEVGTEVDCYTGPEGSRDVGACVSGVATCTESGRSACVGEVLPALDDCATPTDEDCNGTGCTGSIRFLHSFGTGEAQAIQAITFSGSALFAAGTFAGTFEGVPSAGGYDAFVARLDPSNGQPMWLQRFGGAADDGVFHGRAIAAMPDGGVVVAATTNGTREMGDLLRVVGSLRLIRVGAGGEVVFDRTFPGGVYRPTVSVRPDGLIFVAGSVTGTVDLGGGPIDGGPNPAALVAGFALDGSLVFARALTSDGSAAPTGIAVRPDGSVTVVGEMIDNLVLEPELSSLASAPEEDILLFVVDVSEQGKLLRARRFDTIVDVPHRERPQTLTVDRSGRTWVSGYFRGALSIDGTRIDATDDDVFVASLDEGLRLGSLARYGDASGYQTSWGNDVDALGQSVVVGNVNGSPSFGNAGTLVAYEDDQQTADAFVIKLAPDGSVVWLSSLRGPGFQRALAGSIGPLGEVAVAGLFEGDIVEPYTPVLTNGVPHAFVALFDP